MRLTKKFLASFILLDLVVINAYCIIDGGSGLSADELIDASNGIFRHDPNLPENPKEARELWSENSGIDFTTPEKLSDKSTSPEETRASATTDEAIQYQTESTSSTTQTTSSQKVATSPTINLAGNWSFRLRDSKTRVLALTLFQSDDAIYGMGTMNDGGDTMEASSSGTLEGDKLYLGVTTLGTISLYRLALTTNGKSASGEYSAFSPREPPWIGIAEGMRIPTKV
jgi:hypothetical protein